MSKEINKENAIFIVIDSLSNYNRRSVSERLMPFFNELEKNAIYFPNMFSEAPYTEAAVMSMLCGKDTLSEGGYFYRFKNSKTMFDYFHNNGYEVYNYIQPHVYPSSILRSNDHYFYNVCYDFNVVWEYRLYFYSDLLLNHKLFERDYMKIIGLLDDNFKEWIHFMKSFLEEDESLSLIQENLNKLYSKDLVNRELKKLSLEIEKYENDKIKYINDLLSKKKEHILFSIITLKQDNKVDESTKNWLKEKYLDFFIYLNQVNRKKNRTLRKIKIQNIIFDILKFLKFRNKDKLKAPIRYLKNYHDGYSDKDLFDRISDTYDSFKSAPSINMHCSHFINQIKVHKDNNKPFFSCIHIDDIHNPEIFFTYDTNDREMLKKEFSILKEALNEIPEDMKGSISYYLSLVYIDEKLRCFFESLEQEGLLDNTKIFITGDHGFSFDYRIIRNSNVNNHYLENYNVPFIIYSKNFKAERIDNKLCSSRDILPTILDIFNFKALDDTIVGKSLFNENNDYVVLQNIMGGCPDIDYRNVSIGILTREELIIGEASKQNNFDDIQITDYYNLITDPLQQSKSKYNSSIYKSYIYIILKKEFKKLYDNYMKRE